MGAFVGSVAVGRAFTLVALVAWRRQMTQLVVILACGVFARRAILQFPELESVAWILLLLGIIVLFASAGRVTLLEVP